MLGALPTCRAGGHGVGCLIWPWQGPGAQALGRDGCPQGSKVQVFLSNRLLAFTSINK